MFGRSHRARVVATDLADIERRIRALEKELERVGSAASRGSSSVSSSVTQVTDRIGETVSAALAEVADRFRGRARSMEDAATRFGNNALQRLSYEVKARPLMILAVAVGVGLLIGLSGRRH